jgi:hypothetical protein
VTNIPTLKEAEAQAKIFLSRAKRYREECEKADAKYLWAGGPSHASMVRASLDLTKILATMRQGR